MMGLFVMSGPCLQSKSNDKNKLYIMYLIYYDEIHGTADTDSLIRNFYQDFR